MTEDMMTDIRSVISLLFEYDELSGYMMTPDLATLYLVMKHLGDWPKGTFVYRHIAPNVEVLIIYCVDGTTINLVNRRFLPIDAFAQPPLETLDSFTTCMEEIHECKMNGMLMANTDEPSASVIFYESGDVLRRPTLECFIRGVGISLKPETSLYIETDLDGAYVLCNTGYEIDGIAYEVGRNFKKHPLPPFEKDEGEEV